MQDLSRITATEAVKLIRDGHIEPMEIMEACLDRIDQLWLPLDGVFNTGQLNGAGTHIYVLDTGMRT